MAQQESNSRGTAMERLRSETRGLAGALGDRALASISKRVESAADRLTDYVEGGAGPGLIAAVTGARGLAEGKPPGRSMLGAGMSFMREKITGAFGGRGKGGQRKLKLTNIVESIDVGVPVRVAYNQWTQYSDFPKFMKKVESADKTGNEDEEQKIHWKAQVFWSHRTWEATVIEQVPDERIIWRSNGQKGHVDGAVTFHELGPNLTRILLVLEYHPQGMFEHTGNLWRAQGRRARLELKHFGRHMMMQGILQADEVEGWRGTIHDGEVVESHEDAMAREQKEGSGGDGSRQAGDEQVEGETDVRDDDKGAPEKRGARAERAKRGEDEGKRDGEESGDVRAAPARTRASRGRTSGTRSSGNGGGGDGRRQRAGATARRGGSK
jgi:Polyketide cyclase / dehydrase and lipid transport